MHGKKRWRRGAGRQQLPRTQGRYGGMKGADVHSESGQGEGHLHREPRWRTHCNLEARGPPLHPRRGSPKDKKKKDESTPFQDYSERHWRPRLNQLVGHGEHEAPGARRCRNPERGRLLVHHRWPGLVQPVDCAVVAGPPVSAAHGSPPRVQPGRVPPAGALVAMRLEWPSGTDRHSCWPQQCP